MNFDLNETQQALRELAKRILTEVVTPQSLAQLEADGGWVHRDAYRELAKSALLGICLPERVGGAGLGLFDLSLLLQQVGASVAPVPLLETVLLGALSIATFGSADLQARYLPGVCKGETLLTTALNEPRSRRPGCSTTTARSDGSDWILEGVRTLVAGAREVDRILVPAAVGDGVGVFLVDPGASGVTIEDQPTSNLEPLGRVTLRGARVRGDDVLGKPGEAGPIVDWLVDHALMGQCCIALGVASAALKMTAEYVSTREQFGRPIGTFQAVGQRLADAFIDVSAMRVSAWQAAWRLQEGLPCKRELAIAKYWAAEAGHRVTFACQHVHGGIGVDRDYPLHRYFLWMKRIELNLGGANAQLEELGSLLA
jgi:alkylation response protein AidB-like acyl-CoA dehydrogenase